MKCGSLGWDGRQAGYIVGGGYYKQERLHSTHGGGGGGRRANKRLCSAAAQVTQAGSSCSLHLLAAVPLQLQCNSACLFADISMTVQDQFSQIWVFSNSSITCTLYFGVFSWSSFQIWRNKLQGNVDIFGNDFSITIFGTVKRTQLGSRDFFHNQYRNYELVI